MNSTNLRKQNNVANIKQIKNNNLINLLNINVQSLSNKINRILALTKDKNYSIITITEHWQTHEKVNSIVIPKYRVISAYCRTTHIHGGVLIMVNNKFCGKTINVEEFCSEKDIELCAVHLPEIKMVVVAVYRSPTGSENIFFENLSIVLQKIMINYRDNNILVAGDYNIDVLKHSPNVERLLETMSQANLYGAFSEPSRITTGEGKCIDNIFLDIDATEFNTQTINLHIADHLGQIININKQTPNQKTSYIKRRFFSKDNVNKFKAFLDKADWNQIYNIDLNTEEAYSLFHNILETSYHEAFPEKIVKAEYKMINDQWKSIDLLRIENTLDAIYTIIKVTNRYEFLNMYKDLKNDFLQKLAEHRKENYENYINQTENKSKATWKVIQELTGKKNKQNKEVFNSNLTAEEFNNHFIKVGEEIVGSASSKDPLEYMNISQINSIFFTYITPMETSKIITNLKNNHTQDIYGMTTNLLKQIVDNINIPLTYIINKGIDEGCFPTPLKKAKVIPIYKKGDPHQCENYRPISILPTISKIFETVIKTRLINFFENKNILATNQHGYRTKKSTTTALTNVVLQIYEAFDNREYAQIAFCDLSKAFDSVNHKILLQKLWRVGVRGQPYKLLESYINDRKQLVTWEQDISEWKTIEMGVPQGSVLGPLLFLVYINDLTANITAKLTCLFADDTTFVNTHVDSVILKNKTQLSLTEAKEWFHSNNLKLNEGKTEILTLYTINNEFVQPHTVKFLGIYMDECLTWKTHIDELKKKLNTTIYCIWTISTNVSNTAAKLIYHSNFHSHATYGILIWGGTTELDVIFKLQKKAVRILSGAHYLDTCKPLFRNLKILTIPSAYILASLLYIHNNQEQFTVNSDFHSYNTRRGNDLTIPYHRVNKSQHSTNHLGIKLYNKLPNEIRMYTETKFKKIIKDILIKHAFYNVEEYMDTNFEDILQIK